MSTFTVTVTRIRAIEPIPNADAIELAVVGDYRSVIKKGQFGVGDLCAYIPEAAVVPVELLRTIGLEGKLAGAQANRVKAVRFRGMLSQGICIEIKPGWVEGQDVLEELGITKWIPPIPAHLAGQVEHAGVEYAFHYDIDNVKAFPDVLIEGEPVVMTEKCHGTLQVAALLPPGPDGTPMTGSKSMLQQGLGFKFVPENDCNVYVRVYRHFDLAARIKQAFPELVTNGIPVYVLGETLGVQDLKYGANLGRDDGLIFRIFDIRCGRPSNGQFLNDAELDVACIKLGLPRVPVLYRGPFSKAKMLEVTQGKETVSGKGLHVREGTVIKTQEERRAPGLPMERAQLKSVNEDYLLRKGTKGEETTEYE